MNNPLDFFYDWEENKHVHENTTKQLLLHIQQQQRRRRDDEYLSRSTSYTTSYITRVFAELKRELINIESTCTTFTAGNSN